MDRQRCPLSGSTVAAQTQGRTCWDIHGQESWTPGPTDHGSINTGVCEELWVFSEMEVHPLGRESHKSLRELKQVYKLELSGKHPGHREPLDATAGALTTNHILDLRNSAGPIHLTEWQRLEAATEGDVRDIQTWVGLYSEPNDQI